MDPKVVLITGCSTGIGLHTALTLARDPEKGFKVYATMRDLQKKGRLEEEGKGHLQKTLFVHKLDVCSDSDAATLVEHIIKKEGRIDVLINNAGIGLMSVLESVSIDTAKQLFDINVFGVMRTTKAVLPHMKRQAAGHIINISSQGGLQGVPFNDVYCASKFALEGFSESLAPLLEQFNIKITMIEPGAVKSEFASSAMKLTETISEGADEADSKTQELFKKALGVMKASMETMHQTPEDIAEIIKAALFEDKPHFRYQTNFAFTKANEAKFSDPSGDRPLKLISKRFFQS